MFGFLIRNEVRRDAARLKLVYDQCVAKYFGQHPDEVYPKLVSELGQELVHRSPHELSFLIPELRDFHFSFDLFQSELGLKSFSVVGRGRYTGFMLINQDGSVHSSATDSMFTRATSGAKALSRILEREHHVRDFTKTLSELERRGRR